MNATNKNNPITKKQFIEVVIGGVPAHFAVVSTTAKAVQLSGYVQSKKKCYSVWFPLKALIEFPRGNHAQSLDGDVSRYRLVKNFQLSDFQSWLINNCEHVTGMVTMANEYRP